MVLAACLSSLMLLSGHVVMIVFTHEWHHSVLITRGKIQDCEASRLKHALKTNFHAFSVLLMKNRNKACQKMLLI